MDMHIQPFVASRQWPSKCRCGSVHCQMIPPQFPHTHISPVCISSFGFLSCLFSGTPIGPTGIKALSKALTTNTTIQTIWLGGMPLHMLFAPLVALQCEPIVSIPDVFGLVFILFVYVFLVCNPPKYFESYQRSLNCIKLSKSTEMFMIA